MRVSRRKQRGLTLIELIVAFTIPMLLTTMAVPLARFKVRREGGKELRWALAAPTCFRRGRSTATGIRRA